KAQGNYEDSIWNDDKSFWQVLFGRRKDYFVRQLGIELEKLKHPGMFDKTAVPVGGSRIIDPIPVENLSLWRIRQASPKHWRELHDAVFAKHTDAEGFITCAISGFRSKHKRLFQI